MGVRCRGCSHAAGGTSTAGCAGAVGQVAGASTCDANTTTKPIKQVTFASASWTYITDDGFDDFTFDNIDDDGSPRVRQHSKRRLGPPPPAKSSVVSMIIAHKRATNWITGQLCYDLPEARIVGHSGRCAQYEVDPDDNDDVEFFLDQNLLEKTFKYSTYKPIAFWDSTGVYYLSPHNADEVVFDSREDGLQNLAAYWGAYYHMGEVPPKPVAGASTSVVVGIARGGRGFEWIVDSGAGIHMANKDECKELGLPFNPCSPFPISGVGGEYIGGVRNGRTMQRDWYHAQGLDYRFTLQFAFS